MYYIPYAIFVFVDRTILVYSDKIIFNKNTEDNSIIFSASNVTSVIYILSLVCSCLLTINIYYLNGGYDHVICRTLFVQSNIYMIAVVSNKTHDYIVVYNYNINDHALEYLFFLL